MEVSRATAAVARVPGVRDALIERQRRIGRRMGTMISEGRDQGSVVFPDADVKFYMEASPACRADRRHRELQGEGETVELEEVLESLCRRDGSDAEQWAPLLRDPNVIRLDTDRMTIEEMVEFLVEKVRGASRGSP
jgi:cytidylate kinase